ncbi:hypothetical protein GA830_04220 [Mesorhizobium sp. NBSH29]|uniref:hypothetical protein n=1 Tax=Mesorhizobium sp. NBSH29 TaxID=2654249 RepID=UPI001896A4D3|nr:hypothetical protein GA830_04220 [Mesorhizobium sp. NBSH29]
MLAKSVLAITVALVATQPMRAACNMELAVYADRDGGAEINFTPTLESATTTNTFRMLLEKDVVLDGVVLWSDEIARPNGILMHKCPEGDVTGEELAACTIWQGVIYTANAKGTVALLPREGEPAAEQLVFPDLAYALRTSPVFGLNGLSKLPFDVFALSGCQE